jgi:polyhydroxybutyrate depolymerase
VVVGPLTRIYRLHIPRDYRPDHRYPLVLNFHGHGSSAQRQEIYTGFSWLADQRGFVVVYPQGAIGPDDRTGWNSGGPNEPLVNDIAFVSTLLNTLQSTLCIDPSRIYATGFSNGGGMTSVLACTMANRIAAFAPVSGSYYPLADGCHPSRPVPVLEIHGTGDSVVPYDGRAAQAEESALAWVTAWAARDGCQPAPQKHTIASAVIEFTWSGCRDGVSVIHYQLAGGWHVWPGVTSPTLLTRRRLPISDNELPATSLIWQFFVAHPLPR